MPEVELIQDEIYNKCWQSIKSTVRTHISANKDELQTERQWAKQGYVVDRPTPKHTRGRRLWTNANCGKNVYIILKQKFVKVQKMNLKRFLHLR